MLMCRVLEMKRRIVNTKFMLSIIALQLCEHSRLVFEFSDARLNVYILVDLNTCFGFID